MSSPQWEVTQLPAPCCAKTAKGLTCGPFKLNLLDCVSVADRNNNSRIQTELKKENMLHHVVVVLYYNYKVILF